jgi:hypothetical protein
VAITAPSSTGPMLRNFPARVRLNVIAHLLRDAYTSSSSLWNGSKASG